MSGEDIGQCDASQSERCSSHDDLCKNPIFFKGEVKIKMTVKFMIGADHLHKERENQYAHEFNGVRKISSLLWDKLHSIDIIYFVIRNPSFVAESQIITPDMVILSQLGLGIIELKNDANKIHWKPKNKEAHFKQVQRYGQAVWDLLLDIKDGMDISCEEQVDNIALSSWLPSTPKLRKQLRLFTTVCYTNDTVDLSECLRMSAQRPKKGEDSEAEWEHFSITTPADIPAWAASIRWEIDLGSKENYRNYQLSSEETERLARMFFNAQDDIDMEKIVTGVRTPHAFLKWEEQPDAKMERLDREQYILGRNKKTCDILFPGDNLRISNEHLRLTYVNGRYFIEDLSRNGIYLTNGTRILGKQEIVFGQSILCGGKYGPKVSRFMLVKSADDQHIPTEIDKENL
jgi:hypothetical protein